MSDLRSRQKALARREILDALAAVISEARHLDFSVQEVADRAGVALRTVYNHFPSREALLDGLSEHTNQLLLEQGGLLISQVNTLDEVREGAAVNFRMFEAMAGLSEASMRLSEQSPASRADHEGRTRRIIELVGRDLPDVDPANLALVAPVIRHLFSRSTWFQMTRDYGLDTEDTVRATQWAVDTLLRAARAGDLPIVNDEESG